MKKKFNLTAILAVVMVAMLSINLVSCTADEEYGDLAFGTLANGMFTRTENPGWGGSEAETLEYIKMKYSKDEMFNLICSQGNLDGFAKKLFRQYWYALGDYTISESEWIEIKTVIGTKTPPFQCNKVRNNIHYLVEKHSFYSNPEYRYAFGTASVTYDSIGRPVGLADKYDFNLDISFNRSPSAQAITVCTGILGQMYNAKEYNLSYGIIF